MVSDLHYWPRLKNNRAGLAGLIIVVSFFLLAVGVWAGLLGQGWSAAGGERWAPPGAEAWFGTNLLG